MANITERTAYLRGLADGLNLDKEKAENKLLLEMLNVLDELAQHITETDADLDELAEYVEDMDADLADVEEVLFDDEDDCDCCDHDCDCEDCDCDCDDCDCDCDHELAFSCPNCGKTVMISASDIDFDESPVCSACGEPFFVDVEDEDEE
ncbi:MAG: zinc ribbon domain-containing protein [Clostridia bacterium]|nr:zinc ribbon domain-containing protein [Clostridia bacterium]